MRFFGEIFLVSIRGLLFGLSSAEDEINSDKPDVLAIVKRFRSRLERNEARTCAAFPRTSGISSFFNLWRQIYGFPPDEEERERGGERIKSESSQDQARSLLVPLPRGGSCSRANETFARL